MARIAFDVILDQINVTNVLQVHLYRLMELASAFKVDSLTYLKKGVYCVMSLVRHVKVSKSVAPAQVDLF